MEQEAFKFNVGKITPDGNSGLVINVHDGIVNITMNKNQAWRVLAKRELIVGALYKKFTELVEMKVVSLAVEEENLDKGK